MQQQTRAISLIALALALVLLASFHTGLASATYGVDVSTPVSTAAFKCLKSHGFNFAIIRGWRSSGSVDTAVVETVAAAHEGGMAHVDVYFFPCFKCGNPASQVTKMVDYLRSNKVSFGMLWFDIEAPSMWSSSCKQNQDFLSSLMHHASAMGVKTGIYTSASQWLPIMCNWTGASHLPLWYAHYDNKPSFSDFIPFGGWARPAMKQYVGDATECGVGIDKNFY